MDRRSNPTFTSRYLGFPLPEHPYTFLVSVWQIFHVPSFSCEYSKPLVLENYHHALFIYHMNDIWNIFSPSVYLPISCHKGCSKLCNHTQGIHYLHVYIDTEKELFIYLKGKYFLYSYMNQYFRKRSISYNWPDQHWLNFRTVSCDNIYLLCEYNKVWWN